MINVLLSERDLANLTRDQREFLVERINHELDNDERIREIIASKLQSTLSVVNAKGKIAAKGQVRGKGT